MTDAPKLTKAQIFQTHDDAIPEDLMAAALAEIASKGFHYGWHSDSKMPFSHWNVAFGGHDRKNREDVVEEIPAPMQAIWDHLEKTYLQGMTLVRCYCNAHTYGTDGYPHRDSEDPKDRTIVCYMNPEWKIWWAGETVWFDPKGEIIHAVMPKWRRITCFPGSIMHVGRGVSRVCPVTRVVLVFKAKVP